MKTFFELREELEKESIVEAIGDGEYDLSIAMHQWKQGRDRQRAASAAADKAKSNRQKRRDAYAKQKAARAAKKESVELGENQTKAHLRAKSKFLGGASMMDLEKAGNDIRAYAKKSGGSDKKDFDTAADYVIALGRLTDVNKVVKVLQDLTMHVRLLDTDVRDKIISMLPTKLQKKV